MQWPGSAFRWLKETIKGDKVLLILWRHIKTHNKYYCYQEICSFPCFIPKAVPCKQVLNIYISVQVKISAGNNKERSCFTSTRLISLKWDGCVVLALDQNEPPWKSDSSTLLSLISPLGCIGCPWTRNYMAKRWSYANSGAQLSMCFLCCVPYKIWVLRKILHLNGVDVSYL